MHNIAYISASQTDGLHLTSQGNTCTWPLMGRRGGRQWHDPQDHATLGDRRGFFNFPDPVPGLGIWSVDPRTRTRRGVQKVSDSHAKYNASTQASSVLRPLNSKFRSKEIHWRFPYHKRSLITTPVAVPGPQEADHCLDKRQAILTYLNIVLGSGGLRGAQRKPLQGSSRLWFTEKQNQR